jgi:ATP-binding protein involved in chromosome partitioning
MSDASAILKALEGILALDGRTSLPKSGALSEIVIHQGKAYFSIAVPAQDVRAAEGMRRAAEEAAKSVPGITSAVVTLTAEKAAGAAPQGTSPRGATPGQGGKQAVAGVKHIIAVASGKGGVGKSTTACNLAVALHTLGLKVGVLDADIYGPSMPRLFKLSGKPKLIGERLLEPLEGYGLKVMSIGFLVEEETAMIWRGPMVMSAIQQMLREVAWGDLDVLVVDMPPGTGDAQLTLAQTVPLAGSVIVSTPQDLALIDARRGVQMFRKVEIPILGIVENMSYFIAPDTGTRYDIFGHGGAEAEAHRIGVPFLGAIPLAMPIRERSDSGEPVVLSEPEGPHAAAYTEIARKVWAALSAGGAGRAAPRIVIE